MAAARQATRMIVVNIDDMIFRARIDRLITPELRTAARLALMT